MADRPHVPALDGVRGIAIALVLLHHVVYDSGPLMEGFHARAADPVAHALLRGVSWGWMGVDLFFVLSGFLISGILLDAIGSRSYFSAFYARRFLRLAPALACLLVVVLYIVPGMGLVAAEDRALIHRTQWWYWSYLSNVIVARYGFSISAPLGLNNLWSLAVEEQFYLVWPLIVLACRTPERLGRIAVGVIVGAFVLRAAWWAHGVALPASIYVLPITRGDALAFGALLACVMRVEAWRRLLERRMHWLGVGGGALLACVAALQHSADWQKPAMQTIGFTGVGLLATWFLTYALLKRPRWLADRRLTLLGRVSYGTYLWHGAIFFLLAWYADLTPLVFIPLALGITAIVVALSWRYIETPALRAKRRFPQRSPSSHATIPVIAQTAEAGSLT